MPNKPYKDIKCGSYSGYQKHYRQKEPACDACKIGAALYIRLRYPLDKEKILKRIKSLAYKAKKQRQKNRRRARLRNAESEIYTIEKVFELYGINCHICNLPIDLKAPRNCQGFNWQNGLHIDHLIPISKGGNDTLLNVRPSHALCNMKKYTH